MKKEFYATVRLQKGVIRSARITNNKLIPFVGRRVKVIVETNGE